MEKLRILRVIESMDPAYGGPCQGIRNSIPELEVMGATNEVVSADGDATEWSVVDNFTIYKLGPGEGPWGYTKKLLPWLKSNLTNYDVVLVHGLWQYYGYAVRKAVQWLLEREQRSPKFFIMPHGMLDPYFQKAKGRKIKAIRNFIFWNLVERKTLNAADGILFTCQEELVLARETFSGYRPRQEINVGYGILSPQEPTDEDIAKFRLKFRLLPNEDYLLFLSRIHPKKGLLNLLSAYISISEKGGKLPKLVIAGPGLEGDFGKSILEKVNSNSFLKEKVLFTGMLSGIIKWAAFHTAKAFVLPSHQENFGIAVVEALACSCPVLISDKVNIWREISEGKAGIVTEDNLKGTSALLEQFSQMTDQHVHLMKANAVQVYKNHFTIERAAKNLFSILKTANNDGGKN